MTALKLPVVILSLVLGACLSTQADALLDTANGDPNFEQCVAELGEGFPELNYSVESVERSDGLVTYVLVNPQGLRMRFVLERLDAQRTRVAASAHESSAGGLGASGGEAFLRALFVGLSQR